MVNPASIGAIGDFLVKDYYDIRRKVEIDTIQCAESLNDTVLVQVTGWMRQTKKANSEGLPVDVRRKFSQALLLGRREGKGYNVATDIVDYHEEEEAMVKPSVVETEAKAKESAVLEKEPETVDKVSSAVEKEPETVDEKPVGDAPKLSFSSIVALAAPKENPTAAAAPTQAAVKPSKPAGKPLKPAAQQRPRLAEGVSAQKEKEGPSNTVCVMNLPPGSPASQVFGHFKVYGKIKKNGVFVKTNPETGKCYGFVDFEEVESANKAVQASPLKREDGGGNVFIRFKRAGISSSSSSGPSRGGSGNPNSHGRQKQM